MGLMALGRIGASGVGVGCYLHDKGEPAARRGRKATGLPGEAGRQPGRRKEATLGAI
jgi:hypothetical protein